MESDFSSGSASIDVAAATSIAASRQRRLSMTSLSSALIVRDSSREISTAGSAENGYCIEDKTFKKTHKNMFKSSQPCLNLRMAAASR
jgi:hypothetical protein